ncbi:MAG: zinc-binding dehydrogenase [Planctomycetaceae bacterium]|nr:zinc-binding dehydrogenase [Planctomycetaceae bacterium]
MKAALLRAFGAPLTWEDVDTPRPGADDVLIQVMACGTDGTDLKLLDGFGYRPELPFIMGHEPAGLITEVGASVRDFHVGDRVISYNFFHCGRCRNCRRGREQICPYLDRILGVRGVPGGYADYLCLPASQAVSIPKGIPWEDAAVLCDAGCTAYHAVDRARVKLGETVVIFGVGGVGSFAVQFAKLAGARVIAIEQSDKKARWAEDLGVDVALDATSVDVGTELRQLTEGWGADCVIDIVGREETLTLGVDLLCNGGRLVIVGYTPDHYSLSGKHFAQNELEVIGTRCGRRRDLDQAAQLLAQGRVKSIVTERYPLSDVNAAHQRLQSGEVLGRLVLDVPQRPPSTPA